jgi:hypothetical protein
VSGFGYTVLGFGSHPSRGPAALSISLNKSELQALDMARPAAEHPVETSGGEIDVTATAAGGDTSGDGYAYAWTVAEIGGGDDDETGTGVLRILAAGTQNAAQYNSLTLRGDSSSTVGQPFDVVYRLTCTVTDDAGAEAAISIDQLAGVVAL